MVPWVAPRGFSGFHDFEIFSRRVRGTVKGFTGVGFYLSFIIVRGTVGGPAGVWYFVAPPAFFVCYDKHNGSEYLSATL